MPGTGRINSVKNLNASDTRRFFVVPLLAGLLRMTDSGIFPAGPLVTLDTGELLFYFNDQISI
jgi:hypothetical protein